MTKKKSKFTFTEEMKATLFQWWIVGAVYFFIGFGTAIPQTGAIDFIFFLGIGIGMVHILIYYPIIYNMFTLTRNGKVINQKYFQRTIMQNVLVSLGEVLRCLALTILVYFTYQVINMGLVIIREEPVGTVILPGEPILFAVFFVGYFTLTKGIADKAFLTLDKLKNSKGEN